ncbi:MAG: WYL domain-containing protein [Clostridia bacterium]|nr:WYL domain-containing protein [Clostridia bacterium]
MQNDKKLTDKANTICLYKILEKYSDEEHLLSMHEIIGKFAEEFDMKIDRRTVYSSMDTLTKLGFEISEYDKKRQGYYLMTRLFEPSEIRLMMDAVYSQKSIPQKQTVDLIEKLQSVLSIHQRKHYKHLFSAEGEKKTQNRSVFFNIDSLDAAIAKKVKVDFIYNQYGLDKRLHPRRKERYTVSPYGMVCDNQNYYLLCIKEGKSDLSYYRIDLMKDIRILETPIDFPASKVDISTARKTVYAFAGKPVDIKLRCKNSVIGGVIDEFGTGIRIAADDEEHFIASIKAAPQGVLYWTMQYLTDVEILEPQSMRESAIAFIKENSYGV